MGYTVTEESFDSLAAYWSDSDSLRWLPLFVLPGWLRVWWQSFGMGAELYLRAVRLEKKIIGIAPLYIKGDVAAIIGSTDVCDYLDFITAPGREQDFFAVLLNDLRQKGINHLNLKSLRPDSTVLTDLVTVARERKYDVQCQPEDVSLELDLPATWDEYLATLAAKQRHEVKRKLRRLEESGKVRYLTVEDSAAVSTAMDTFLALFAQSSQAKATFMTARITSFFRSLADSMAEASLLRLGILELDRRPIAMVMAFDYRDGVYLYNSSYAPDYRSLSVGLLSKVLFIKDSIEKGRKRFDFLKGGEPYKYHLGGREVPLYGCQITIK